MSVVAHGTLVVFTIYYHLKAFVQILGFKLCIHVSCNMNNIFLNKYCSNLKIMKNTHTKPNKQFFPRKMLMRSTNLTNSQ